MYTLGNPFDRNLVAGTIQAMPAGTRNVTVFGAEPVTFANPVTITDTRSLGAQAANPINTTFAGLRDDVNAGAMVNVRFIHNAARNTGLVFIVDAGAAIGVQPLPPGLQRSGGGCFT